MKIKLNSGREIMLSRIEQWRTYAGMLAGIPHRESNGRMINQARSRALEHCIQGALPYLVPPQVTPIVRKMISDTYLRLTGMTAEQSLARDNLMHYERLPSVTCVAVFDSDELKKTDSEPYSSLTVFFFQEDFALPVDARVLVHIQSLDWESLATDWCW